MKGVAWLLFSACLIWLLAASFDFSFSGDKVTVYSASLDENRKNNGLPILLPHNPSYIRVADGHVVKKIGSHISRYEDCAIYDIKNWRCTYQDQSGNFGISDGEYWEQGFGEASQIGNKTKYISELRFHLIGCQWDFADDSPIQWGVCLLRPFLNS